MKIGIFGGSFNPIHNGHVMLARQLREQAGLDRVWMMVSPQNPLKHTSGLLDEQLRYQLCRLALHGEEGIEASDYEFHLPRPSYTWHTLQKLSQEHSSDTFTLLIGGDNWERFPQWYCADKIVASYPIVIYPRRGSIVDTASLPPGVTLVNTELIDVSSTEIREKAAAGMPIEDLVPKGTAPLVRRLYHFF